jgi:hypothetical protein
VVPVPRLSIPIPKITPATAAPMSKGSGTGGSGGGASNAQGPKSFNTVANLLCQRCRMPPLPDSPRSVTKSASDMSN